MNSVTYNWIQHNCFNAKTLKFMNKFRPKKLKGYNDLWNWEILVMQLKRLIPLGSSLDNHNLYVDENATALINAIFNKHVDENTIVITSNVEHNAVEDNLRKIQCKNLDFIRIKYHNDITSINLTQIKQAIQRKKYLKAFVYIIGTQITTGEVTPQEFYIKIKEYLESKGIQTIMVIDDVHGMYLHPRDYTMFDYVICTAHALIRRWDMGMIWSKTKESFGIINCQWLKGYNDRLKMLMLNKDKFYTFSSVLKEEFNQYLLYPYIEYIPDSVQYIFSVKVIAPPRYIYSQKTWEKLAKLEVRLETQSYDKDNIFYIRMRASQYITFPELLSSAIKEVKDILDKVIEYKEEEII